MMERKRLFGLAALALTASSAADATIVPMPLGATDIHFLFAPGECTDRIGARHIGGTVVTYTFYGCDPDSINKIDFVYNDQPDALKLFGIFEAGAPQTIGRKNVTIIDAWWTRSPNVFYEPVWNDGKTYVVTVPEPASWALLISGFGLVGLQLRHRRSLAGS